MTYEQLQLAIEIFDAALGLPLAERDAYLSTACASDESLRSHVERLLLRHEQAEAEGFLEQPALPDPDHKALRLAGRRVGPYLLLRELGSGGMGVVYLAVRDDGVFRKEAAVKLVWPALQRDGIIRRFNQERQILARLDHPNIARLLDGGATEEGWPYLVMEYVDGIPITDFCDARKLNTTERLKLFRAVCAAVAYAHQNLIVHRDLKPGNIFVTANGEVKLLDFGIAKLLNPETRLSELTLTGVPPLTTGYASPEQMRGDTVTTASDVYSLGVLLYELLTGHRPYPLKHPAPRDLVNAIAGADPELPSAAISRVVKETDLEGKEIIVRSPEIVSDVREGDPDRLHRRLRGDLDNIALLALRKDPRQRYQTIAQFSDDISHYLAGEPVSARPTTLFYRTGKFVRRNKTGAAVAATVLLLLLAGLFLTLRQNRLQRYQLYTADMRQAGQAWAEGNLVQMDALLEAHRPGTSSDEWRGLEWFSLWKLLHTEKFTLRHQVTMPAVIYTPDGKTLLTGGSGLIEKWDAHSGQPLGLFASYPPGIYQLQFFNAGARLIVNSGPGRHLSIWDYPNQRKLIELSPPPSSYHRYLFFTLSPDETKLITSIHGLPFQMWDTATGQLLATFPAPAGFTIPEEGPAIYSRDGRPLCLVVKNKHFELWDLMARRSIVRLDPQSDDPRALLPFNPVGHIFSQDGTRYYLPTEDLKIRVWDYRRGGGPLQVFAGHEHHIETPALSRDGKLLASGSDDRTLRLWDTQTGKLLVTVKNESQTFSPAFSPDDRYLAAVNMRALRTKVWDVQQLLSSLQAIKGVQTLGISPDGKMLTVAEGMKPGLRDLRTGQELLAFDNSFFTPCGSYDCARVSADGSLIALRKDLPESKSGAVVIREDATGRVLAELAGHAAQIVAIGFAPDGKTLAIGYVGDGLIKLWDTATWRERITLRGHAGTITSLDFSPDSSKLASSSYDSTVRVWSVASGQELFTVHSPGSWMLKTRFSTDGRWLASADMGFTIKLWDAATGREVRTLKGHANSIYALAFSPDGRRLASGSDDHTIRLWDLQTGAELTALRGHTGEVWQVFFTADGKTMVSSGQDGTRIWRTATEEEVRARIGKKPSCQGFCFGHLFGVLWLDTALVVP